MRIVRRPPSLPRPNRAPTTAQVPQRISDAHRQPCRGCTDKRAAELVRAARARGASQDEILRLLREQRLAAAVVPTDPEFERELRERLKAGA